MLHRFDRTNSSSHHDAIDANNPTSHTPLTSTSSYGSSGSTSGKGRKSKAKTVQDYEEGLDSLQNEPSGWGKLPSPKPSDLDNGTEFWGVPPDDLERQMREKSRMSHASTSSAVTPGDMGRLYI